MPRRGRPEPYEAGFDALDALEHSAPFESDVRSLSVPCPPPRHAERLLICHDTSGLAPLTDAERRYTFEHWNLITDFCFFSHRRVTLPPPAYTIAAHRNGCRSLGTLIVEGQGGARDAITLVTNHRTSAPSSLLRLRTGPRGSPFDHLSLYYIDLLIELCLAKGFDGYLLNFEVDLGVRDGEIRRFARAHASALLAWVECLRAEVERRVPHGSIVWYDSVTVLGDLRWQCRLTPLNTPFFVACKSMFLDYHWRPEWLSDLGELVRRIAESSGGTSSVNRREAEPDRRLILSDVMVGIDIYGRGMVGRGGFDTHVALKYLPKGASVAIFAPAWTRDELSGPRNESWSIWRQDDDYLWHGGASPPASFVRECRRRDAEDDEKRRQDGDPPRSEPRTPFRPIADLVPMKRPVEQETFSTCFARAGSDHAFRIGGVAVMTGPWTDVAMTAPVADRVSPCRTDITCTSEDSWVAGHSLRIDARGGEMSQLLCSLRMKRSSNDLYKLTLVWKGTLVPEALLELQDGTNGTIRTEVIGLLPSNEVKTSALSQGWLRTTMLVFVPPHSQTTAIGVHLPASPMPTPTHLGLLSLQPAGLEVLRFVEQPVWELHGRSAITWRLNTQALFSAAYTSHGLCLGTTHHPMRFEMLDDAALTGQVILQAVSQDGELITSDWL